MTEVINLAILGLGAGAAYALLAQGLLLVYRGSGVLNFAHGAIAMVATFVSYELATANGWPIAGAILIGIVTGIGLALATYFGLMRPLAGKPPLTRVIGTLAVLITLQSAAVLLWGVGTELPVPFLPTHVIALGGGIILPVDRLILVCIAVGVTAALWLVYRFSSFGMATRAAAESAEGAAALGWSPDFLAAVNWGLGGALAAGAGILLAPQIGLQATGLTLLVIAALAAVLAGGFQSFPLTLLGALVIGVGQSELSGYVTQPGVSDSLPFAVIAVILVLRGRTLPQRGYGADRFSTLGTGVIRWKIAVPVAGAAAALVLGLSSAALTVAVTTTLIYAIMLSSIVVVTGYGGQLSLAQFAFGGVAAFVTAKACEIAGMPFIVAFIIGIASTLPVGIVFGLPAVRTRGVNLAAVTLGLGLAIELMLFDNSNYTGGPDGIGVPAPKIFGLNVNPAGHSTRYAGVVMVCLALTVVVVSNIRRSAAGRRLIAVKANERAAASLGISVVEAKLYAFAVGAAIAGMAGILFAFQTEPVFLGGFDPLSSIFAVGYAVIGGVGYVIGPLFGMAFGVGGIGSYISNTVIGGIGSYVTLIGGASLILILLANANGIAELQTRQYAWLVDALGRSRRSRRERGCAASARPPAASEVTRADRTRRVRPKTLTIEDLTVRYGAVEAVSGASLSVSPGTIVGLIGPNGAGKTTLIDAVTGFVRPAGGRIFVDGEDVTGWTAHRRSRGGLRRSFQSLELFEDISLKENLQVASEPPDRLAYFTNLVVPRNHGLGTAATLAVADFGLSEHLNTRPTELPYGARRLAAVARAVACEPSVLLLDEPAAGLDEIESSELARLVRELADRWGMAVLLVEHDMDFVMSICDRVTVLDFGRTIAEGTPDEVTSNPIVVAAYLGEPGERDDRGPGDPQDLSHGMRRSAPRGHGDDA